MKKFLSMFLAAVGITTFLPLVAIAAKYSPPSASTSVSVMAKSQCMQQAVAKRGSVLIDAFNGLNEAVTHALKDRVVSESRAWGESDVKTRERLLKSASQTFDEAYRTASKDLERRKDAAWKQFESESRSCKAAKIAPVAACLRAGMDGKPGVYVQCPDKCVAYCPDGTPYNSCVQYFADPCMNHSSTVPSIAIVSPNGGETYKKGGNPITVYWKTMNVSESQLLNTIRLRAYPDGQEYNLVFDAVNDGQEVVYIPSSVPSGAYTIEIKSDVNGTTIMDASDSYFKIIDATESAVWEQVKCVFEASSQKQTCYSSNSEGQEMTFMCSGIETCVADVQGPKGASLTWKSSCGGYAYTTMDGNSEHAKFFCGGSVR